MKETTRERILALGARREALVQELPVKPSGLVWAAEHSRIADDVVAQLYEDILAEQQCVPKFAIIATGGYGRRELCPNSDIDITIVPSDESSLELDTVIRALFQDLHWAYCTVFRIDVGWSYRLISDAPGLDAKTRTGLLDMRLLQGDQDLFMKLEEALHDSFAAGEFILSKIEERAEMYRRFHETPLVIEPHLKEGAGGLRDFHCANWIGESIGERSARPTVAYDTIMRYRNLLHYAARKPQDQLSRSRLDELAALLKVDSNKILSDVVNAGSELHKDFERAREKLHEARFPLSSAALAVGGEVRLLPISNAGDAAVGVAFATKLGLRVSDLPMKAGDPYGGASAIFAISTGEKTVRNLDRCTLLEQLLPELVKCRALVPENGLHTYTVLEHSLRVVGCLDSLNDASFLGDIKASITDPEPLYLAALLHDIGKVDPEQDHSIYGAELARGVCARWNLAESVRDLVVWLIQEHLTMSRFMRIRDLHHHSTIKEFAEIVKDPERLMILTLLTWADAHAVSAEAWTAAQSIFLKELYSATMLRLQGEVVDAPDASQSRQRLLRQLKNKPDVEAPMQEFLDSLPVYFLAGVNPEQLRLHRELVERARNGQPMIEHFARTDLGATEVTVCCPDAPGLLCQLLGVIYAHELTLLGIRACTTSAAPSVALDIFTVSFNGRPVPPATMAQLSRTILDVVEGRRSLDEVLASRGKDGGRRQRIFNYNFIPGSPVILEIHAPRGRGMAFRFSKLFAENGWNVLSARVGQWAGNAAAAFYLTDEGGAPLSEEKVREALTCDVL